jgi:hypothetical protein
LHLALLCCLRATVTAAAGVSTTAGVVVLRAEVFGDLGRADVISLFVRGLVGGC